MAWREELHPRDARGRFARKGSMPAVSIKTTLSNLQMASDDDLFDVYHRLSSTKRLDKRSLAAIDAELARREGKASLPPPVDTPEQVKVDELVGRGYSYAEAFAEAYGRSSASVAREQADVALDRRRGETREQAIRRSYQAMVALESLQAEEATRGNLLSRRCPHADPRSLWSGPAARARKCASEELLRWWEEHGGRRTYTEWRARFVAPGRARQAAERSRLAGSGRDFGT